MEKPSPPITVKAKLGSTGLLTISFNKPVRLPSYLMKQAQQKIAQGKRNLGTSLFWEASTFEVNTNAGFRPPPVGVSATVEGGAYDNPLSNDVLMLASP
jgi:hypothetical protein